MFGRREPAPPREGLVVGPQDQVHGTMAAQTVTVAGTFDGTLTVAQQLSVVRGGRVSGEVEATSLDIAAGGAVQAMVRIGVSAEEAAPYLPTPAVEPEPVAEVPPVEAVPEPEPEPPVQRIPPFRVGDDDPGGGAGLGW